MQPTWQGEDGRIQLYLGDCRPIIQKLELEQNSCITDPVWPNAAVDMPGRDDPYGLLSTALQALPVTTVRIAIHMGVDSDPRFLSAVPPKWPFFRVAWLRYVRASYKGRLLQNNDVAYLFGCPPKSTAGNRVIPGEIVDSSSDGKQSKHPCPRKLKHVQFLVKIWSELEDLVLDPFMGSGTTGMACIQTSRRFIGIEIEPKYFEIARDRIERELQQKRMF